MPMYDFRCTKCENVFEDIVPFDGPSPPCPECGQVSERLMAAPFGFVKKRSRKGEYYHELQKKRGTRPKEIK